MSFRNDPATINLSRRLTRAEQDAALARAEVEQLKTSLPNDAAIQAAAVAGETVRAQRRHAKRLLADRGTTLDDLNAIDASVLTPAMGEQLRMNRNDALMAQELSQPQPMLQIQSPAALQRIENWKQQSALGLVAPAQQPAVDFGFSEPPTQFQRWAERQDSPAGRRVAARSFEMEQQKVMAQRRQSFVPPEADHSHERMVGGFRRDIS